MNASGAMNLMKGPARSWALPYLETIQTGGDPFPTYADFEITFNRRFAPLDSTQAARDALKSIRQGKRSVVEYMSHFDQYIQQTGWSSEDHRQRFYNGLNDNIKDILPLTNAPVATFDELRQASQSIDTRVRQRDTEKKGKSWTPTMHSQTPARDPNAMEVDATKQGSGKKTHGDFQKFMTGKCYGCGSKDHTKKDGNHERDVCNHCQKAGHRSTVCFFKFVGQPSKAKAKAAATSEDASASDATQTVAASVVDAPKSKSKGKAPAQDSSQQDLLAKLVEQVKAQETQIASLNAAF